MSMEICSTPFMENFWKVTGLGRYKKPSQIGVSNEVQVNTDLNFTGVIVGGGGGGSV